MRFSLSTVALSLAALSLPSIVVAADPTTSVSTITSTRTVYRITTETHTGAAPTGAQNSTSTAKASAVGTVFPSGYIASSAKASNTAIPPFTGAASRTGNLDAAAAAIVAVAGLLML